jgi:hypothetical protein
VLIRPTPVLQPPVHSHTPPRIRRVLRRQIAESRRAELAERTSRFLKAELKGANVTYAELAERLKEHCLVGETEASIKAKLKRGLFPATFMLAVVAAIGLTKIALEEL